MVEALHVELSHTELYVSLPLAGSNLYPLLIEKYDSSMTAFRALCLSAVVQSLSRVPLFVNLWTAAHQSSLSFTNS